MFAFLLLTESHPGLCLNALGYGNEAALVNDPVENPLARLGQAGMSHPLCQRCESQAPSQQAAASGAENPALRIGVNCEVGLLPVREVSPWQSSVLGTGVGVLHRYFTCSVVDCVGRQGDRSAAFAGVIANCQLSGFFSGWIIPRIAGFGLASTVSIVSVPRTRWKCGRSETIEWTPLPGSVYSETGKKKTCALELSA